MHAPRFALCCTMQQNASAQTLDCHRTKTSALVLLGLGGGGSLSTQRFFLS
eukprot:m.112363 g.112363  ORF g.112363 m.112363 type:complete len:51 (-) comp13472_c0_seq1:1785-1937(-)